MATIEDIEWYPIVSLLIFFTFFVGAIIFAYTRKKSEINEVSQYPLND